MAFKTAHFPKQLFKKVPKSEYDVVVIGGGHNGLVAAGYLQRNGMKVCVLERRHVVGGAAVTEEIVPGFKFSRASYVLSLLRPSIVTDLELKKFGLKVHLRSPSSYTPLAEPYWKNSTNRSLTLGPNEKFNFEQIKKFSVKDAESYIKYEKQLERIVKAFDPLLDLSPSSAMNFLSEKSLSKKLYVMLSEPFLLKSVMSIGRLGVDIPTAWQLITAPIKQILDQWFESEPLRATLATDALIGAMLDTNTPGSGYVLLHHVMGELEGRRGAWGYPEGGMGAVTQALAASAEAYGAHILTNQTVKEILVDHKGRATGVVTVSGEQVKSRLVLSNATPFLTFLNLLPKGTLPEQFEKDIRCTDYASPVTKINGQAMPHHQTTIHLNCEHIDLLDQAYKRASMGYVSEKPMIEMVIPSVLDKTLAPEGAHVCLFFTQFTPYDVPGGWTEDAKEAYALKVFNTVEHYAPGFKESIIDKEVLPPPELESIFGLTGGNIFHGAMSLSQLLLCRPTAAPAPGPWFPRTPVPGLLLCGAGAHPGGGVMGAPGRIAAAAALAELSGRGGRLLRPLRH